MDTETPAVRARTAVLVCALALGGLSGIVSASFGQTPAPPATPTPPTTPAAPGDPEDPGDPGSEPPAGSPTAPAATTPGRASKLDPFPVVVIAGRQARRTARVTELVVRGPRRVRVVVRCRGERCPIRRVVTRIPKSKRLRVRRAERVYRVHTSIEIRVTHPNRIGKYTKVRFRPNRIPARTDACLQPGAKRPSRCPR